MNKTGKSPRYGIGRLINVAAKAACVGLAGFCFGAEKDEGGAELGVWISRMGGFYDDKQNWSEGIVPGKDERALFNLDITYKVRFKEDAENNRLVVNKGRVLFDMQGSSYFLNSGAGDSHKGSIEIGEYSGDKGELNIIRGVFEGYLVNIGVDEGATGKIVVDQKGELKNQRHGLFVGGYGKGRLEIIRGGKVLSASGIIGTYAGSVGEVVVKGKDSVWQNQEDLAIGYSRDAMGKLELDAMGKVENEGSVFVGGSFYHDDGIGELIVKNGFLKASDIIIYERGLLFVKKGEVVADGILSTGEISGGGKIDSYVENRGVINPGIEIGGLDIERDYLQGEEGILCVELDKENSDLLRVSGKAVLGGGLEIKILEGIEDGRKYEIVNCGEREGEFESVKWDGDGYFDVIYDENGVFLEYHK